jgi:Skp family chaperone for outer membrane proteins
MFVLAAAILVGSAVPALAQAPQTQAPPKPATPAAPAPQAPAPLPFPADAKIAYVDFQRVASESEMGKAAAKKLQDFSAKKQTEGQDKNKQLQAMLDKQKTQGSVLSEAAAKQLEADIAKAQRDLQYFQNEAQAEAETLNNELMQAFQRQILPIVQQVQTEKGLYMVFDVGSFIVASRALDITPDVITRANATLKK